MSEQLTETCPHCHMEFIKLSSHLRHCKENPDNLTESEQTCTTSPDPAAAPKIKKHIFGFLKRTKEEEEQPPNEFLTMAEKLEEKEKIKDLSPEEKFKRFFAESQSWSIEPPKLSILTKIKRFFFPSEITYKKCVFVSENSSPKFGYYPFDPKDKYLFLPDGRIYDLPQSGETWFFNADKFLPLIHSKDPGDIYDLPIHYATAIHNDGIQYGQTMGFNDLISSITSLKIITTIVSVVAIIAIVGAVIIVKQTTGDVASLTAEIQGMKTLLTGGSL